jgi:hypothetical protein
MTDLAARIADVKKKAEAAAQVRVLPGWQAHIRDYRRAASPDLFLAMASRIEELDKAPEPFKCRCPTNECVKSIWNCPFRTAARALRGEG